MRFTAGAGSVSSLASRPVPALRSLLALPLGTVGVTGRGRGASVALVTFASWPRCWLPGLFENSSGAHRICASRSGVLHLKFTLKQTDRCRRDEQKLTPLGENVLHSRTAPNTQKIRSLCVSSPDLEQPWWVH